MRTWWKILLQVRWTDPPNQLVCTGRGLIPWLSLWREDEVTADLFKSSWLDDGLKDMNFLL